MEGYDAGLSKECKVYSVGISGNIEDSCISKIIKVLFLKH